MLNGEDKFQAEVNELFEAEGMIYNPLMWAIRCQEPET